MIIDLLPFYRLQDDIRSDPWVSIRFKKYMAGPKRVPFKNHMQLKKQWRSEFWLWFFIGAAACWPLAIVIGRRSMTSVGGVALAPRQRWVHDWPNVHPNRTTFRVFRRYALGVMIIGGTIAGRSMADMSKMENSWYTRPDLKPKAAMVDDDEVTHYDNVAYKQLLN